MTDETRRAWLPGSHEAASLEHRPPCPVCTMGAAVAFKVFISEGRATVTYRCPGCAHEWTISKPYSLSMG